ncbi:hypothetical protein QAD02_001155 [Eretmocerus hayati]|uniref:Uncharacterized protein n=1 Tax=Eretmocerus hayati TaxID=131215 RepID=A0ACC2NGZ2_9HYME|nr:hypothetical protein QAD02_001155 [Eretmocerus hayati]
MDRNRGETKINVTERQYTWTIKDFTKNRFLASSERIIRSPTFVSFHQNVQYSWSLELYSLSDEVLFHLHSNTSDCTSEKNKSFKWQVNLLDNKGKIVEFKPPKEASFMDYSTKFSLGRIDLGEYAVNGNLPVLIKIYFDDGTKICGPISVASVDTIIGPEQRLLDFDNFESLLTNGKYYDLTLVVGDKEFHVHKDILSLRSPVFSAMFEHDMQEKNKKILDIPDVEPEVMSEILRFIYAGKVESNKKLDVELLLAANKYGIQVLQDACEVAIAQNLNADNLNDVLTIVDLCVPNNLLEPVVSFMKSNSETLKKNEKLREIMTQLSSSLLAKVIDALM